MERKRGSVSYKQAGFKYPDNEEWEKRMKDLTVLAARDRCSISEVYRMAIEEYHHQHFPGNPGLPLEHWTAGLPLSKAAKEKLQPNLVPPAGDPPEVKKVWTLPELEAMSSEDLERLYRQPGTGHADRAFIAYVLRKRYWHLLGDCYCGRHHYNREAQLK